MKKAIYCIILVLLIACSRNIEKDNESETLFDFDEFLLDSKVEESKTRDYTKRFYNSICSLHLTEMEKQNARIAHGFLNSGWSSYSREIRKVL